MDILKALIYQLPLKTQNEARYDQQIALSSAQTHILTYDQSS